MSALEIFIIVALAVVFGPMLISLVLALLIGGPIWLVSLFINLFKGMNWRIIVAGIASLIMGWMIGALAGILLGSFFTPFVIVIAHVGLLLAFARLWRHPSLALLIGGPQWLLNAIDWRIVVAGIASPILGAIVGGLAGILLGSFFAFLVTMIAYIGFLLAFARLWRHPSDERVESGSGPE